MTNDIGVDKKQQRYIIKKIINIAIRASYYIFCCRNRNWDSPDLMQFRYFFFWLLFLFLFLFLFFVFCVFFLFINNPISSSICKLPIRSDIYNCTFKNTNKVSIIIIVLSIPCRLRQDVRPDWAGYNKSPRVPGLSFPSSYRDSTFLSIFAVPNNVVFWTTRSRRFASCTP